MKKKIFIIIILFVLSIINVKALEYLGDVNGDGKIGVNDYILIRKHLLKVATIDNSSLVRADVNKDGKITILDYVEIKKIILYNTTPVPISNPKEICKFDLKSGKTKEIALSNINNINKVIQCAKKNGIVNLKIPKGDYYFEISHNNPILLDFSNFTLDLNGSIFNVYPNSSGGDYWDQLVKIDNKDDGTVSIKNGVLKGDRTEHFCPDGSKMFCSTGGALRCEGKYYGATTLESNFGILISSIGVNVENLKIIDMMGDGIYIRIPDDSLNKKGSINIINNVIDNCRRNGISIINGKNINIKNNTIKNVQGTLPQSGIDIERGKTNEFYENVLIEGNSIYGNKSHRSIILHSGVKGSLKVLNNHFGDQIYVIDDGVGGAAERELITIANNDVNIPSGVTNCVSDANDMLKTITKCEWQSIKEDMCKK